jgi:hypothetical protein
VKPGPELDEKVATQLFHWKVCKCTDDHWHEWKQKQREQRRKDSVVDWGGGFVGDTMRWSIPLAKGVFPTCNMCGKHQVLEFSKSIRLAWLVVERAEEAFSYPLSLNRQPKCWEAIFWDETDDTYKGEADNAATAICIAGLKMVGAL